MFNKNIEVLRKKNPILAEKLINYSISKAQETVKFHIAKNNEMIISYKNILLEDIDDPILRAKIEWEKQSEKNLKPNDFIIIYGLGLGYLFKRAFISCQSRIIIYEPNLDILRFVLNYVDLSNELSNNRVFIFDTEEDYSKIIENKFLQNDKINPMFMKEYVIINEKQVANFTNNIIKLYKSKSTDYSTILMNTKNWTKNIITNTKNFENILSLDYLNNIFQGKTALIIAAGPSLNENITQIKANRNKFVIFCVCKIVELLAQNGIKPDFVIYTDSQNFQNDSDLVQETLKTSNTIASYKADTSINEKIANSHIFYCPQNNLILEKMANIPSSNITLMSPIGTVTGYAYNSAIKMGFSKIIFVGLDLTFTEEKAYADGSKMDITQKSIEKIKNIKGQIVNTRSDYKLFINQLENLFKNNSNVSIFNTSLNGAKIEGMEYKKLEEIPLINQNVNVNETILEIKKRNQINIKNYKTRLENLLKAEKEHLERLLKAFDMVNLIQEPEKYPQGYAPASKELIAYICELMNNSIVAEYIQSDVSQFLDVVTYKEITSKEDYVSILKLEQEFMNIMKEALKNINEILDKTLN